MHALASLLTALALSATPPRAVPTVTRAPRIDGVLKDLPATVSFEAKGASVGLQARLVESRGSLIFGLEATDDSVRAGDVVTLTLHFPGAGATAAGHTFRFAMDGKRATPPEEGTSAYAQALVKAVVKSGPESLVVEASIPARALPRFNVEGPLVVDVCVTYDDQDAVGAPTVPVSTCKAGTPLAGSVQLGESFRKSLALKPPRAVQTLQGSPLAWLGYGDLQFPRWALADAKITPGSLSNIVGPAQAAPPAKLNLPATLELPDGRALLTVLSGVDPYVREGECDSERELRLALYLVKGREATRALEWPAVTCTLGRVLSAVVNEEATLTMGYSNGASVNFAWSGDHFERTEIGRR